MIISALDCTQTALDFLNSLSLLFKLESKQLTPTLVPTNLDELLNKVKMVVLPQIPQGVQFVLETSSIESLGDVLCDGKLTTHYHLLLTTYYLLPTTYYLLLGDVLCITWGCTLRQ